MLGGCTPPKDRFISDVLGSDGVSRTTNYGATGSQGDTEAALGSSFQCIAELGDSGCGFEAPLEAIHRALDGSRAENDGFLRPGAFLAIVILTDEDDCSLKDTSLFDLTPAQLGGDAAGSSDFRCQPMFAYACDQPISGSVGGTYTNCRVRTDTYLQDPAFYSTFLAGIKDPAETIVALVAGGDAAGNPVTAPATISTGRQQIGDTTQDLALQQSCQAMIGSKSSRSAVPRSG